MGVASGTLTVTRSETSETLSNVIHAPKSAVLPRFWVLFRPSDLYVTDRVDNRKVGTLDHPYIEFTATPPFIRFHWPIGLQRYDDKMEQMKWVLEECEYELAHAISVAEKPRWNQRIKRVRKAKEQLLEEAAFDA